MYQKIRIVLLSVLPALTIHTAHQCVNLRLHFIFYLDDANNDHVLNREEVGLMVKDLLVEQRKYIPQLYGKIYKSFVDSGGEYPMLLFFLHSLYCLLTCLLSIFFSLCAVFSPFSHDASSSHNFQKKFHPQSRS